MNIRSVIIAYTLNGLVNLLPGLAKLVAFLLLTYELLLKPSHLILPAPQLALQSAVVHDQLVEVLGQVAHGLRRIFRLVIVGWAF